MAATRFIEEQEFHELIAIEGDTLPLYKLTAIPFKPPTPDGEDMPDYHDYKSVIRVMLLNVKEPRLYKDKNKVVFLVLPSYDTVTYDVANECHPVKDAWCYRFSTYGWDKSYDLDAAVYLTSEAALPAFELGDLSTH